MKDMGWIWYKDEGYGRDEGYVSSCRREYRL